MVILKIHFSRLRNEAHYQFLLLVMKLFITHQFIMSIIGDLFGQFEELLDLEGKLVDAVKASEYTKQLAEVDKKMDRYIIGINASINSGTHHFDENIVKAAEILKMRMKAFHTEIERKSYSQESAAVKILVRDFRTEYAQQVSILNLNQWIMELESAQTEFENLFIARNTELVERPQERLKEVRKKIDATYRLIIGRIEAYIVLNGTGSLNEFVNEMNREINYFNEHAHHRKVTDIKHAVVESIPDQPWNDEPVVVFPTVAHDDKKLIFSRDYTLLYKNNNGPGTATVIIDGKGAFNGQKIVTFNIVKIVF
jgi:hypothetical protein